MKKLLTTSLLVAAVAFFGNSSVFAHGGTYKGPGDTVPPGGAGAAPAAPSTPSTPSTPSSPSTPSTPATPNTPNAPATPPTPGQTPANAPATQGGAAVGPDLSRWVYWWEFNKDRFLNLKAKVHGSATVTDTAGALAGLGAGAQAANTLAPTRSQIQNIIVPALFEIVGTEDDSDIATGVMIALAKIGMRGDEARKVYAENLKASIQEVSETAALSYGIMKDEGAIPDLMDLLLDTPAGQKLTGGTEVSSRIRTFAAYGLGLIGQSSSSDEIKNSIANVLYELLITDKSAVKDIRVACVIAIGVLDLSEPADVVNKLSAFLDDDSRDTLVLAHVPNTLAKLLRNVPAGDATRNTVIDQLISILDNKPKRQTPIRQSAVQAVGMLATANDPRNEDIFKILDEMSVKGRDQQLKHYTAISMAYLGAADPTWRPHVTKFLMQKMKKSSTLYEPWCGLALGVMAFMLSTQGETVSPAIHEATLDKFKKVNAPGRKSAYAIALGLMKNEGAKGELREALGDVRDSEFRGYTAISLGLLNAREHIGYLGEIVDDSKYDPDLLKQSSIGLGLMKDRNGVTRLLEYLNPQNGRTPKIAVLSAVATALGFIGDKSCVQPLIETLSSPKLADLGRAFAAVSLGMVADKDTMPWNSAFGENLNYRAAVSTLIDQATGTGILDIL